MSWRTLVNMGNDMLHATMSVGHGYPGVCYGHMWSYCVFYSSFELYTVCLSAVSHLESLKHEQNELQHLLQNQKFTPADVERINREKRELQQTISSLSKSLEDAEQHKWNEEIALAKVKEKVLFVHVVCTILLQ